MDAPRKYAEWMSQHEHVDRLGLVYRYHSRSDAHSKALCGFIMEDLLEYCSVLKRQVASREVVWGTNIRFRFPISQKDKTLDLVIGPPVVQAAGATPASRKSLSDVFVACEAKSVMTEHGKSQPRVFDELNSSHGIVHAGRPDAIAAGITVVNIASTFVSPLRQVPSRRELAISHHHQPDVAAKMVQHLRGLPLRNRVGEVGFDAYATIVVECDNQGPVTLWTDPPAPQPGAPDSYDEFVRRIGRFYEERFAG